MVFATGGAIFIPFVLLTGYERAGMAAVLACCPAMTSLLYEINGRIGLTRKKLSSTIISTALYLFTVVHLFAVDREASIIIPIYKNLCEKFMEIPPGDKYVFSKVRYDWDSSPLTLRRPHRDITDPRKTSMNFARLYAGMRWELYAIPEELRKYRKGMGDLLPGEPGIRLWGGHIVSENLADTVIGAVTVTYRPFDYSEFAHASALPFQGADGEQYVYIVPSRSMISTYLSQPSHLTFVK